VGMETLYKIQSKIVTLQKIQRKIATLTFTRGIV
jgi:hypothetical protein